MFRNHYDNDVSIWSPQGRIYQIEYAMEAVKQGSATVGLKSKTHAVLCALKRAPSELSAHQKKIEPIDFHIGISIAGLSSDARILARYMRTECMNYGFVYGSKMPALRLVDLLASKCQAPTMKYGHRPFGVGFLIAAYDDAGPHLYQLCPSANYYDCYAMAIGARSQSARTYFEKNFEKFQDCNFTDLVTHGLLALRDTLPADVDLTLKNLSIGAVGFDQNFVVLEEDAVKPYLDIIEAIPRRPESEDTGEPPAPETGERPSVPSEPSPSGPTSDMPES